MVNGYSICLNKWALDKDIKSELGLLLIISSLCAKEGYCYASNEYLANLFDITEQAISNKIKKLEKKNYIIIDYKKRGCEILSREIRLKFYYIDDIKKVIPTIKEKFKDNNISNNIINNNNYIYKGEYKRIKLKQEEYDKLIEEYNKDFIDYIITRLDEYVESNNNKNKYKNFNLVIRKAIRENWFKKEPDWFNKKLDNKQTTLEEEEEMNKLLNEMIGE